MKLINCVRNVIPNLLQVTLFTAPLTSLQLAPHILCPTSLFLLSLTVILVPYIQLASIPPDPNVKESGDSEAGGRGAAHEVTHPVRVVEQAIGRLLALLAPDEAGAVQHRPVDYWGGEEGKEGEKGDKDDEGGGLVPWLDRPEADDGSANPAG